MVSAASSAHRRLARRAVVAVVGLVASVACADRSSGDGDREPGRTWTPSAASLLALIIPRAHVSSLIAVRLAAKPPKPLGAGTWAHVRRLYNRYGQAPLWLIGDGIDKTRVSAMIHQVTRASADGLRLEDYPFAELSAALDTLSTAAAPTAELLANVDLMLTATYVAFGEDLMTGQVDPRSVNQDWHIRRDDQRLDSALFRSIRADDLGASIELMRPHDAEYDSLRAQLAKFRLVAERGWTQVPIGKLLSAGERESPDRLAALRIRLAEEGYFGDSISAKAARRMRPPRAYTRIFAEAVGRFQAHHGILVDQLLGPETVDAMNVPARYRASQIAANLERYRWMPRALGERYVMVNLPEFKLAAYDSGRQVLEMKVIVGDEFEGTGATPVFADTMQYVVFRPYWNVTPKIQAREFTPKIATDPGFLRRGGYEYYRDGKVTRIRQRPGPSNSLGLVKFVFPNRFNIYLHDTPNGELFKQDVRAFSHGCIRVEKPDELARFVLGWEIGKIDTAMRQGPDNREVGLKQRIPIFITYFTTYVTDGSIYFGNDLYKRDDSLADMMTTGALPSDDDVTATRTLQLIADQWDANSRP